MAKDKVVKNHETTIERESAKEENNMATSQAAPAADDAKIINAVMVKQPQTVLDLDTGVDAKITVEYTRYDVNEKNKTATLEDRLKAAADLVQPIDNQIDAYLKYASNASYTAGKNAALAKGNYLTSELRRQIVALLSNNPAFAEQSAKEIHERWLAGYRAKSPKALQWLERAQQMLAVEDLDF